MKQQFGLKTEVSSIRKLLINFLTSNTGGVINFKKDVIKHIDHNAKDFEFEIYCLVSVEAEKQIGTLKNIKYCRGLDIPKSFIKKILFYERKLEGLVKIHNIDIVLNFGDIPANVSAKQIFYFDWPYAVYDDFKIWSRLRFQDLGSKLVKRLYFKLTNDRLEHYVVQTNTMKKRLSAKIKNRPISVIDVGFNEEESKKTNCSVIDTPKSLKPTLIYPTIMYAHKNVEILLSVAKLLKAQNFEATFELTFSENSGKKESRFIKSVKKHGLSDYFSFLGRLSRNSLVQKVKSSTAIIMPTLIETYGLPYLEAQLFEKVMFTSDRDFAREICGDSAIYFDPNNAADIAEKIVENILSESRMSKHIMATNVERAKRVSWTESTRRFLETATLV
ncbi:hypothetical protein DID78_01300 [Candidatus Marinamargulisbacteria bacterium SCGC AG-343-D04]|nr:hypothetical protein DID78_01300 [Candidatus Marinamargulisbacteria bacterium SCGC AG-343-D04]